VSATAEASATPPPITWDLAVEANAERTRVAYFADVFSGRARPAFELALSRQTRFAGMIGERLKAGGLPQDLTYLALIESWYNPDAYSKAAAVGMWQFMAGTARGVGLRVDWWVDERRDPVRSTEGAVRLLRSLHTDFGSFFLAAAAYNGGSGRVSRGLNQFAARIEPFEGEDRYFALSDTRYLRAETRDYVPKMIAAALVAKQPDRYGLRVDPMPAFAFDSVRAPAGAPLPAIARAIGVDVGMIGELNPHVLRGMAPPTDSLWVRVPPGSAVDFDTRYFALDSADRVALTRVTSKKGESMTSIARRHKLTAKQLNWYNPKAQRLKSGNLVPGQPILVPSTAVAAAARDVPNPAIERYPRRRAAPVKPAAKAKPPATRTGSDAKVTTAVPITKASKAPAKKKR
jgi:membrane-bound lytic murein transglycosylase D